MVIRTAKRTHLTRSCVAVPQRAVVLIQGIFNPKFEWSCTTSAIDVHSQPLLGLLCLPRIKCPYASGRAIIEAAAVGEKSPKRLRRAGRKQQGTTRTSLAEIGTIISHRSFTGRIVETVHVVLAVSTSTGTLFTKTWVTLTCSFAVELGVWQWTCARRTEPFARPYVAEYLGLRGSRGHTPLRPKCVGN